MGAFSPAIVAVTGSSQPRLWAAELPPEPGPGEVRCQTLQLGICGTDREIILSQKPAVPSNEPQLILGHECLGRIEAVGEGVLGWKVGDLVVPVVRRPTAGVVTDRIDLYSLGPWFVERGIFREHGFSAPLWLDRPEHLHRVSADIADIAIFAEPLAVVEKGVNEALLSQRGRLGPACWTNPPPRMLVTGMGPIGFAGILASRARGWPVTMAGRDEPSSFRARLAESLGATYLSLRDSQAWPTDVEQDGFDLLLECSGSEELMLAAVEAVRGCGVIVWLGCAQHPVVGMYNVGQLMRSCLVRNQLIVGSVNAAPRDFVDALTHLRWFQQHQPRELQQIITSRISPVESLTHFVERPPQGIKTVLMYG